MLSSDLVHSEMNDITIKERLIHLLAVRPYKKQELYAKINKDGIGENQTSQIGGILKSISYIKKNLYYLKLHAWDDVNEKWQFYTDEERENVKKRKPKNLTQPKSEEDVSSISGESAIKTNRSNTTSAEKGPSSLSKNKNLSEDEPLSKKEKVN